MTPASIRASVVAERIAWIREMISAVNALPLESYDEFRQDPRNAASAESYLRRGIEALLDLGRHILAKGFAVAATEYKEIGVKLAVAGALSQDQADLPRKIAWYRSRMVYSYSEVTAEELYALSTQNIGDLGRIPGALVDWLRSNPDRLDQDI